MICFYCKKTFADVKCDAKYYICHECAKANINHICRDKDIFPKCEKCKTILPNDGICYVCRANDEINKKLDPVKNPHHYNTGEIEVIDAIEDWKLGFHLGNVIKYVARAGKKDPRKTIEDLEKAKWYLEREIECRKKNL